MKIAVRAAVLGALLSLVLALGPAPGGVAGAAVPAAAAATTTHHSVAAARAYIVGKWTSGPNSYTKWQRIQITGSHQDPCFDFFDIDDVMHQYVDPTSPPSTRPVGPRQQGGIPADCPQGVPTAVPGVGRVVPLSWYNPFSWDWGHILSSTWNTIWDNCLKGATEGVVGTASGATIVNLLARGGKVFVGPYGYAAIAVGGCVVNMAW